MMMKLDKRRLPGVLCMMLTVTNLLVFVENPVSTPREEMQMEKKVGNKEAHRSKEAWVRLEGCVRRSKADQKCSGVVKIMLHPMRLDDGDHAD
jgi:hypothetical protein